MAGQAVVRVKDKEWLVSLAVTPWELEQGLGGMPELPLETGMLFDLGLEQTVHVTTVPMLFPLDIAFLSDELAVTEVYQDIEPAFLVTSIQPARYFIEVNAGELEGIAPGDAVDVELLPLEEIPMAPDWLSMTFGLAGFLLLGTLMVSVVSDFTREASEDQEEKPAFLPHVSSRKSMVGYELKVDRMGNIIVTRSDDPLKDMFLQFESDKALIYDLLKKGEKKDLDAGWKVKVKRSEPRASVLDELWESAAKPQKLPQTVKKPTRYDVKVETWQERDRLGIWITDKRTDKVIAEWWDDGARQMFEDGFFKPGMIRQQAITGRDFEESVKVYAESVGILAPANSAAITPRPGGGTPVADLVEKWSKAKRNSVLALKDLESISQRYDIADCKEALLEYRDIDRSDYSDPEEYQEARDEAWEAFIECLESLSGEEESEIEEKDERETSGKGRAAIPQPHSPKAKDKLEFLPDSPEYLAYTIDDIGYRDRIDSAFLDAIARAKRRQA